MGSKIIFLADDPRLLRLAHETYDGLPRHRMPGPRTNLRIRLVSRAAGDPHRFNPAAPPPLGMLSGEGWLGGATTGADLAMICPQQRAALVAVSQQTLRSPYHTRYELIEFTVFTLTARVRGLTSLHAACVGRHGAGVLLMGSSGAGKSTVTMLSLMAGLDFLAEDAVFVAPDTLLATSVPNYLHVQADSLKWLSPRERAWVRRSPVIRRRSGARKFELDLRGRPVHLARQPLRICAVAFLSPMTTAGELLRPLSKAQLMSRLKAEQGYAASQPQWPQFSRNLSRVRAFELRRGRHPSESVEAIEGLLRSG